MRSGLPAARSMTPSPRICWPRTPLSERPPSASTPRSFSPPSWPVESPEPPRSSGGCSPRAPTGVNALPPSWPSALGTRTPPAGSPTDLAISACAALSPGCAGNARATRTILRSLLAPAVIDSWFLEPTAAEPWAGDPLPQIGGRLRHALLATAIDRTNDFEKPPGRIGFGAVLQQPHHRRRLGTAPCRGIPFRLRPECQAHSSPAPLPGSPRRPRRVLAIHPSHRIVVRRHRTSLGPQRHHGTPGQATAALIGRRLGTLSPPAPGRNTSRLV